MLKNDRWEMVASFQDLEFASAVAKNRSNLLARNIRLVKAIYEDGKLVQQDIIAEVGSTREHP